jgi:catalase-peroxidase
MAVLEPRYDGFRNYMADLGFMTPAQALIDKADLLNLTVSEMTVLAGWYAGDECQCGWE